MCPKVRYYKRWLLSFPVLLLLAGCGSGGGRTPTNNDSGGGTPTRLVMARFDVNVRTGKVTITNVEEPDRKGRAVLTGGAVSLTSSDLINVGGDSGKRLIRVSIRDNTGEGLTSSSRLVISNLTNSPGIDYKANTTVSTMAGSGAAGSANGYRTSASFNVPVIAVGGQGPNRLSYFISDNANHAIRVMRADGMVETFAGSPGSPGFADGVGTAARFSGPHQIATDANGNIFVADTSNRRVRRITPLGEVTTIAGTGVTGSTDGAGNVATFGALAGIAVTSDGNRIYVADTSNHTIRRIRYTASGPRDLATSYDVETVLGMAGSSGFVDGEGANARFNAPTHLAINNSLYNPVVFVADLNNHAIRRFEDSSFGFPTVRTIAGTNVAGNVDGVGAVARLTSPYGISWVPISSEMHALVVSEAVTNHQIRVITYVPGNEPSQDGNYYVITLAGTNASGYVDGDGNAARFNGPGGVYAKRADGPALTVLIGDRNNHRIRMLTVGPNVLSSGGAGSAVTEPVRLVNWDAELPIPGQTAWAKNIISSFQSTSVELQFYVPEGVSGFSFMAYVETNTSLVNLPAVGASYLTTVAGNGSAGDSDGPGKLAQFNLPQGIAAKVPLTVYSNAAAVVADANNHRIRLVLGDGSVRLLAGSTAGFADGVGSTALFTNPYGIAVGPDGNVYISDFGNRRIRRMTSDGAVTTIAGTGASGSTNGTGDVATFTQPTGISVDRGGRIYVADLGAHVIRRIDYVSGDPALATSYRVITVAGSAGAAGSVDGTGSAARFNGPIGVACDSDDRVYVTDYNNHTVRVMTRATSTTMTVTTLAGLAGAAGTVDGIGAAARFNRPYGIDVDSAHNLYVTDFLGYRLRRVSPLGEVKTLIGSTAGFTDGTGGLFGGPGYISLDPHGNIWVSDRGNHAIRTVHRVIREGQDRLAGAFNNYPPASPSR